LYNRGSATVDLSGWSFVDSIAFTFPSGTSLAPGEYLVLCSDAAAIAENYGISNVVGNFTGDLPNGGGRITLLNAEGTVMDTVRYRDDPPWPIGPDQEGQSLECLDPFSDNDRSENWRACRVPEPENPDLIWDPCQPAEWTYVETTCTATSNRLYFYAGRRDQGFCSGRSRDRPHGERLVRTRRRRMGQNR